MSKMVWRTVEHAELAHLLNGAELDDSCAVGHSTVYHFSQEGREYVALSLPDGRAILVEPAGAKVQKRRHIDPVPSEESSPS